MARKVRTKEKFSNDLFCQFVIDRRSDQRDNLIFIHQGLALTLARRYANKGEDIGDLTQVALIGLMNAIDRFDPSRGLKFSTFATPTIEGEIKRYFRDKRWGWKVPRQIQDLYLLVVKVKESLRVELCCEPSIREISQKVDVSEEEVAKALALAHPMSFDSMSDNEEGLPRETSDFLGTVDDGFEHANNRAEIEEAFGRLSPQSAKILRWLFFQGLSQVEVAKRLSVSQMCVSRFQARALGELRAILEPQSDGTAERKSKQPSQLETLWLLDS